MAIATAFGWPNGVQIVLAIVLAFAFGYTLTMRPVLRAGVPFRQATGVAFASDTVSISVMEAVDNLFVLVVPGALSAGLVRAIAARYASWQISTLRRYRARIGSFRDAGGGSGSSTSQRAAALRR